MTELIINDIVKLVIAIAVLVFGRYIIPFIKANVDYKQLCLVLTYVEAFVETAEVMVKGKGTGEKKLELVTGWMNETLKRLGINMTEDEIRAEIENAVAAMNKES